MGGSKLRDNPANIVVMCSVFNSLMESHEPSANLARLYGWKLRPWEDPTDTPLWNVGTNSWQLLQDDFTSTTVPDYTVPTELIDYF